MPKVRVEGRDEVYRFPDDTPREEIARQLRNYLFPRRPQQNTADTVAQTGSVAGLFAPGSGVADALGVYPTGEGTNYPSMMENILSGNFSDAGYQALGVVGDISYATAPITGPIGVGIGMAAKAPRAARAGTRAAQDIGESLITLRGTAGGTPWRFTAESARIDNPGGQWLADHIEDAEQALQRGRKASGPITARWRGRMSPDVLRNLPGENGEHLRIERGDSRVMELIESIGQRGYDESNPVALDVNHRGEIFIYEGNHRVRAAAALGLKDIPVEVRYLAGGEAADGPYKILEAPAGSRVSEFD